MFKEFKEFALRGNVFDLAVAFILGAAFGKIVTSVVNDLIMPLVGVLLGNMNFSNFFVNLSGTDYKTLADAQAAGAATLNYGLFISTIVDFLIVALVMFIIVKQYNRLKGPVKTPVTIKDCPYCSTAIPINATRCPNCTSQL